MVPLGRHLANNYLSPLASRISQLSILSSSKGRTTQDTTIRSTAGGQAWYESTDGIDLLPNDGAGAGFGDRTSRDSNQKNVTPHGLQDTYTVTTQVLPHSQILPTPQNAIRVDNDIRISRNDTKNP